MAGYARQSSSSIADGETITAAPLNSEFDALLAAFAFSGGHNHDGTSTEGAYVGLIADVDALNKIVVDTSNNRHGFFVEVSSSAVEQIRIQDGAIVPVTDSDIDLGTSSLEFKDLYIDGTAYIDTLEVHVGATLSAGVLTLPDGSASAPVITNASDTNQGLYFSGTDEMSFTAGGTAQVTFADGAIKPVTDNDIDLGTSSLEFKNLYIDGTANIDTLAATTMSGNLAMGSNSITGLAAPSADGDAARKAYVDDSISSAEGLTQLAGNINVNGFYFYGSSGEDIKFQPVGSASLLATQDNDGEFVALVLRNESDAADTTGIASLRFDLEDTGGNTVDAAKIAVKKEQSFTATASTQDSKIVLSTSLNGTLTEYIALTSAGALLPVTDNTVDIGSSSYEIKDIYVDGTAYIDAIGFGSTSVTLPTSDGSANQILKTDGSGTISWASDTGTTINNATENELVTVASTTTQLDGEANLTFDGTTLTLNGKLAMASNTAGKLLIADGTDFEPTAVGDLAEITSIASDDVLLAVDTSGGGLKRVARSTLVSGLATSSAISNVVEDTTPQLGGDLDVDGNALVSTSNGNIALTPNGTGVVRIDGNVDIQTGEIVLKNGGSVSNIKFYCESSNAHYTQLQSAAHSDYSGNVTLTLPAATDTLVGKATTDTLTNKTLTTPVIAEIDSGGDLTLDATTDIILDADGGDIFFKDGGTTFGSATNTSGNLIIKSGTTTALTFDGANVAVSGDLTVNGTTTTVNSTTVTIDDPIFTLGGDTAPGSDDNKDRGIEFRYHTGSAAKVGFFGYDDSAGVFTFIPDATNSSEVFSGTAGNVAFGNIAGTLTTAAQTNITSVGALDGGSITSGFGAIDNGTSGIRTNTFTAETSILPDAVGGADLGSTSAEWGDVYIADDKKIYFGNDQDISMEYDEDGIDTLLISGDITLADDKKLYFGSAKDVSLEYDEDGNDTLSVNGDLLVEDDKKLYLGSGKDFSIEYDENGNDTTAVVAAGGVSFAPHGTSSGNGTELRFQELAANGANYVGFKAPDSISSNEVWVLPNADGNANQVLKTDGSNALSWVDQAGGGTVSLVADGAITAGKPVVLTAAGKAAQVVKTSTDASSPTKVSPEVATMDNSDTTDKGVSCVFDSSTNHFVMAYKDTSNNSGYGTVVAGKTTKIEKSTAGVTWGTPTVFISSVLHEMPQLSAGGNKVHVSYRDSSGGGTIKSITVTESSSATAVGTASYAFSSAFAAMAAGPQRIDDGSINATIGSSCYDTNVDRFLTVYKHVNNSEYGTAVVHYISNTGTGAVTWGTPSVFHSNKTRFNSHLPHCQFDDSTNRVGIMYLDEDSSYQTKSLVATITGGTTNSVAFGTHATINSGTGQNWSMLYDAGLDRFIASGENGTDDRIHARVGYITGGTTNTFTWGTSAQISTQNSNQAISCVDTNNDGKVLLVYNNHHSGNKTVARIMTALGGTDNSISASSETTINSGEYISGGAGIAFDPANDKFLMSFTDNGTSNYGFHRIITYSGTTISYGSRVQDGFEDTSTRYDNKVLYAGGTSGQFYHTYRTGTGTNQTNMNIVSVSGTTPSFATTNDIMGTGENSWQSMDMLIDPDTDLLSVVYGGYGPTGTSSQDLHHVVISAPEREDPLGYHHAYDTANNYIHLVYSSGTTTYVHPVYYNTSTDAYTGGTPSTLMSGATATRDSDIIFDPDTNRSVVAYRDTSNSDIGTANVIQSTGTAGSPTVTIGSDVTFDGTDDCADVSLTYDTANDRVFICYVNTTDTKIRGTLGTVTAGTNSISFAGTADVYDYSSVPLGMDVIYNSDKGVVDLFARNADSSNYLGNIQVTTGASSFSVSGGFDHYNQANTVNTGAGAYGPGYGTVIGVMGDGNSNKVSYHHRFYLRTSTTNLNHGNFLGLAAESISDEATGKITIFGGVNENQSGLTIGNHYFSDGGGTVGLDGDEYVEIYLGQAIAADKIKMRKNEGYLYGTANNAITAGDLMLIETTGKFTAFDGTTTTVSADNFIGIATKTVSAGGQAEVATAGTVVTLPYTSTSSDLTIGTHYFANSNGSLGTSGTINVGTALSTTQIVVAGMGTGAD